MDAIEFPVICIKDGFIEISQNEDNLTITTKSALKNNYFINMLIVDSKNKRYKIKAVEKLHSVGPFWGYNIFLNQKIKIEILFEDYIQNISLEELKNLIFKAFRKWDGWESGGNLKEIMKEVQEANSFTEVYSVFERLFNTEY